MRGKSFLGGFPIGLMHHGPFEPPPPHFWRAGGHVSPAACLQMGFGFRAARKGLFLTGKGKQTYCAGASIRPRWPDIYVLIWVRSPNDAMPGIRPLCSFMPVVPRLPLMYTNTICIYIYIYKCIMLSSKLPVLRWKI